jgi:hypothetical protein
MDTETLIKGNSRHKNVNVKNDINKTKLAKSLINTVNLKSELMEYACVNNAHADELNTGFAKGFRLGYLGPRLQQKSKNLVSVVENSAEVK